MDDQKDFSKILAEAFPPPANGNRAAAFTKMHYLWIAAALAVCFFSLRTSTSSGVFSIGSNITINSAPAITEK